MGRLKQAKSRLCQLAILIILSPMLFSARILPKEIQPGLPLQIAQSQNPRKAEADRLSQQGEEQYRISQFEAALRSWQAALSLYQQISDRLGEGKALDALGNTFRNLGDSSKAVEYHQQSLAIFQELKDRQGEADALSGLGDAYYNLDLYLKAIEVQQQALVIFREIKDRQGEGRAINGLSNAYYDLGDYRKTIAYDLQRLRIAREVKDRQGEQQTLGSIGIVYATLGDSKKAIEYHRQGLAIAQAINNRQGEAYALRNLGSSYRNLRDYSQALEYYQQSLAIFREIKDRWGEGSILNNLGGIYSSLGDKATAFKYYQERLVVAREIKDRSGEISALSSLGSIYFALGDFTQAIQYYQQSLVIAREINHRQLEAYALVNLGSTLFQSGQFAEAEAPLLESIKLFESLRQGLQDNFKVSLADRQGKPHHDLQRVLIAQNKVEPALEISERGRARAFLELLAQRTQGKDQLRLGTEPLEIATIKQIAREQNATLVEYTYIYDGPINVQLRPHSELFIWVVKPTGEVVFRQVNLRHLQQQNTSLDELVVAARRCLGKNCEESEAATGSNQYLQHLHQLLIDPISDLLPRNPNDRVIFIPHNRLFLLPFAALQDKQGQYLLEKHTISVSPSIQVLQLTRQRRQQLTNQANNILLVGNPTMPTITYKSGGSSSTLIPLAGAEEEVKAIAKLLNVPALMGKQATEIAVRNLMPRARIIHLATHGLLDDLGSNGIPGVIALAPSKGTLALNSNSSYDGLLTADELFDLKLQAELVVLSACNTGRGKITGDGVIGLSRALITAGVPSVVVSLWTVPDSSTAQLMTHFYRYLKQGKDKTQALRQAMLETKKDRPDPLDWASFVLIGESK